MKWSIHRVGDSNTQRRTKIASPLAAIAVVASFVVPCAGLAVASTALQAGADTATPYPLGTPNSSAPSGMAPPSATALPGYTATYAQDFTGTSLPSGWFAFSGAPAGDPGGEWLPSQVKVGGGVLTLTTQQLPLYGSTWLSGGASLGSLPLTYGAFFVRSRMTGPGPTQAELLWPSGGWPPEVDFDETYGGTVLSQATDHYGTNNDAIHENLTSIGGVALDMKQWHTWGVVWTPTSLIYTVDGQEWGSVTQSDAIPNAPMTLNIQQQTWCSANWACPSVGTIASTQVDWVSIYKASGSTTTTTTAPPATTTTKPPTTTTKAPTTTTSPAATTTTTTKDPIITTTSLPGASSVAHSVAVSPFAVNSSSLSTSLKSQVAGLARTIKSGHNHTVLLVGMAGRVTSKKRLAVSRARAEAVAQYLRSRLKTINAKGVTITAVAQYNFNGATLGKVLTSKLKTPSVIALIQ